MSEKKRIPLIGSEEEILELANYIKKASPDEVIEITIHLRSKPFAPELPSLEEISNMPLHKRKHLSHEEFEKIHGADPIDVETVKLFAKIHHLDVKAVHLGKRDIHLQGTVKAMCKAFGVELLMFKLKKVEQTFRTHKGKIYIPGHLQDIILSITGLSNAPFVNKPRYYTNVTDGSHEENNGLDPHCPYLTPSKFAELYNFPSGVSGKGQTIGIIELGGGYEIKYIEEYFKAIGRPMPNIIDVKVGKGCNNPGQNTAYDGEVCLDIEVAGAVAPEANIVVYFAPDSDHQSFYRAIKQAIHDKKHKNTVISISWGGQEEIFSEQYRSLINRTFQEAALLGITVCASASDFGSSDSFNLIKADHLAHVDFPSSSPWCLACGGTTLITNDDNTGIESETVWNDGELFATGGGVSTVFPCPPYQEMVGIIPKSANPGGSTGRGIPDVAGNASMKYGYITKVNHYPFCNGGGTSAVAPLWAALIALLNEKLNTRLGFINPILYKIEKSEEAFNDITEGNNQNSWWVPGYTAQPGWDACTGLGTPNGENLFKALKKQLMA